MAIVAAVVVIAAIGYWWLNRPPGRYKPDNSGLYPINVNGKYGFMDRSGKTMITPQFDGAFGFSEGLAPVRVGTKCGYINTKGVVAITPQFDFALQFRYGRAGVKLGDRWGFIDKDGKYINSPNFSPVAGFSGDLAPVRTADGVMAFVNRSGKIVLSGKFEELWPTGFTAGLAPAKSGGKWGFIDATGKWIVDPQFEGARNFADGLAPVIVGGRTGYIDKKGKFVVNPQYDSGDEFYDGYASFASGGKLGFIDTKGRVVSDAKFLAADHFSDGLAPVKTEDGWGFIDRTGKMVVSPQFDTAEMFQNGLARVTAVGKEAYITTTGAFVVDPFPGTTLRDEKARLAAEAARAPSPTSFVGVWKLEPDSNRTGGDYIRITKDRLGHLQLTEGFDGTNGSISWKEAHNIVSMEFVSGRLQGTITSYNFRATHGVEFEYRLTVELLPTGDLHYNVASALRNDTRRATIWSPREPPIPSGVAQAGAVPSFDCAKAATPTERLICRDSELSAVESRMASTYGRVAKLNPAARREQAAWFRDYSRTCNAAVSEVEMKDCVTRYLTSRTQILERYVKQP